MVKIFRSVREIFRHYLPEQFKREEKERAERLGPYEDCKQSFYNTEFIEPLLDDFREAIRID